MDNHIVHTDQWLFDKNELYPNAPGSKNHSGPSVDAAQSVASKAAILRDRVLAVLRPTPLTAHETAEQLQLSDKSVSPRLSELVTMGLVVDSGKRRQNASGKSATVWRVV